MVLRRLWAGIGSEEMGVAALAVIAVVLVAVLSGCRVDRVPRDAPTESPTFEELAGHHHERLNRLETVYGSGIIELRWRDEDGRHYEQGNMELWLGLPRRVALRVFKAGRDFLWIGSDDSHFWIFDMTGDETILTADRHDTVLLDDEGEVLSLQPLVLLDAAGLGRLDEPLDPDGAVEYDADRGAWVAEARGRGGPIRVYFDVETLEPVRVEALNSRGEMVLHSRLADPLYVERRAGPEARIPRRIHIEMADGGGRISLGFDRAYPPSDGKVDDMFTERVFDFEALHRRMPPDVVEGHPPGDGS